MNDSQSLSGNFLLRNQMRGYFRQFIHFRNNLRNRYAYTYAKNPIDGIRQKIEQLNCYIKVFNTKKFEDDDSTRSPDYFDQIPCSINSVDDFFSFSVNPKILSSDEVKACRNHYKLELDALRKEYRLFRQNKGSNGGAAQAEEESKYTKAQEMVAVVDANTVVELIEDDYKEFDNIKEFAFIIEMLREWKKKFKEYKALKRKPSLSDNFESDMKGYYESLNKFILDLPTLYNKLQSILPKELKLKLQMLSIDTEFNVIEAFRLEGKPNHLSGAELTALYYQIQEEFLKWESAVFSFEQVGITGVISQSQLNNLINEANRIERMLNNFNRCFSSNSNPFGKRISPDDIMKALKTFQGEVSVNFGAANAVMELTEDDYKEFDSIKEFAPIIEKLREWKKKFKEYKALKRKPSISVYFESDMKGYYESLNKFILDFPTLYNELNLNLSPDLRQQLYKLSGNIGFTVIESFEIEGQPNKLSGTELTEVYNLIQEEFLKWEAAVSSFEQVGTIGVISQSQFNNLIKEANRIERMLNNFNKCFSSNRNPFEKRISPDHIMEALKTFRGKVLIWAKEQTSNNEEESKYAQANSQEMVAVADTNVALELTQEDREFANIKAKVDKWKKDFQKYRALKRNPNDFVHFIRDVEKYYESLKNSFFEIEEMFEHLYLNSPKEMKPKLCELDEDIKKNVLYAFIGEGRPKKLSDLDIREIFDELSKEFDNWQFAFAAFTNAYNKGNGSLLQYRELFVKFKSIGCRLKNLVWFNHPYLINNLSNSISNMEKGLQSFQIDVLKIFNFDKNNPPALDLKEIANIKEKIEAWKKDFEKYKALRGKLNPAFDLDFIKNITSYFEKLLNSYKDICNIINYLYLSLPEKLFEEAKSKLDELNKDVYLNMVALKQYGGPFNQSLEEIETFSLEIKKEFDNWKLEFLKFKEKHEGTLQGLSEKLRPIENMLAHFEQIIRMKYLPLFNWPNVIDMKKDIEEFSKLMTSV